MKNYQIIIDEYKLKSFIEWLPNLQQNETFYCCLFARSKYVKETEHLPHIRSDKAQLKRFTSNKERLFDKIKQLECPIGSYKQKDIVVPQEALALYITINPRDLIKANKNSVKKLFDLAMQKYNGFNPHQEVMSEIQKSKSKTRFVTFDFDVDKVHYFEIADCIRHAVNQTAINIVETRGGFHVIIEIDEIIDELKKTWYNDMCEILNTFSSDKDNKGDIMIPVVGTYQGGHVPKFIF